MNKRNNENQYGITIIALVITIVVLLILAGVSISMLMGENGIIKYAKQAKKETEETQEKEKIQLCIIEALAINKSGILEKSVLQKELDKFIEVNKTEVLKDGENLYVYFTDTNRYYMINENENVEGPIQVKRNKDKYPGDITKDSNGNKLTGTTEEDAYQINCIEDLCAFSNSVNNNNLQYTGKYIKLMNDLDFKSDFSYINGHIEVEGDINSCESIEELQEQLTTEKGFLPIGYTSGVSFRGNFNGNYYKIINLYQNITDSETGLFANCWNAKIENIIVSGKIISNGFSGGIIGYARATKIINCINKVDIYTTKTNGAGGIVGTTYAGNTEIINCINYGNLYSNQNSVSGILGWDWAATTKVYNCYNVGNAKGAIINSGYAQNTTTIVNTINRGTCENAFNAQFETINSFSLLGSTNKIGNESGIEYTEEQFKSQLFVEELNRFITTGATEHSIDTTGWAKWVYNENEYPTLDLKTIWNGTEWQTKK